MRVVIGLAEEEGIVDVVCVSMVVVVPRSFDTKLIRLIVFFRWIFLPLTNIFRGCLGFHHF
jgi:hypothetical protein